MNPHPRPPRAKPAKAVKARKMYRTDGEHRGQFEVSTTKWMEFVEHPSGENFNKPVFVLDGSPDGVNRLRWAVEQTYLRCADAEITDPWEIAKLVLASIGIDSPAQKFGLVAPRDGKKGAK